MRKAVFVSLLILPPGLLRAQDKKVVAQVAQLRD